MTDGTSGSAEERASLYAHIAEGAYFAAENRIFIGGDPIQDWLAAEQQVLYHRVLSDVSCPVLFRRLNRT